MRKKTKLCPFRKVVEWETDGKTGKMVERERFQPCVEHKCMAYVYMPPFIVVGIGSDLNNWWCARVLKGGTDDGA